MKTVMIRAGMFMLIRSVYNSVVATISTRFIGKTEAQTKFVVAQPY